MTTEPKFVPNEAIPITLNENVKFKARFIDCVGYLVNNAIGYMEKMTFLEWLKLLGLIKRFPFEKTAEIGTRKVIQEHSTIGILITTDGSFSGINRSDYVSAEERVARELTALNKPFVIVLNSSDPTSDSCKTLASALQEKYSVSVIPMDCSNLTINNINEIFGKMLFEFPVSQINIKYPSWIDALDNDNWLKKEIFTQVKTTFDNTRVIKNASICVENFEKNDVVVSSNIDEINLGTGSITISLGINPSLFYKILTELSGNKISNEYELFSSFCKFAKVKKQYDRILPAIESVKSKGYGIITPSIDELILDEPEMVKQGSRYGVKLKAKALSIHMIKNRCRNWNLSYCRKRKTIRRYRKIITFAIWK